MLLSVWACSLKFGSGTCFIAGFRFLSQGRECLALVLVVSCFSLVLGYLQVLELEALSIELYSTPAVLGRILVATGQT